LIRLCGDGAVSTNEATMMGSFYTGKAPLLHTHRTGLFRPIDNKQAAIKRLHKDDKEWF
jgi:hypothetical protein